MKKKLPLDSTFESVDLSTKLPLQQIVQNKSENSLRPKILADYVGQKLARTKLQVFMEAAKSQKRSLDHVLLSGPPGLGKTTLAHIIAEEMKGQLHSAPAPSLQKPADLMAILTALKAGDVFFIDEIHRLSPVVEESLFLAMEDFKFEVVMGEGMAATPVSIPLERFTLVGATTQSGKLSGPFRSRFGIQIGLDFYDLGEMQSILERSAKILGVQLDRESLKPIAARSRGTPRIANALLARVRDVFQVLETGASSMVADALSEISVAHRRSKSEAAELALDFLDIDRVGLQPLDRKYLQVLCHNFKGGPAGVEALAASLSEDRSTLEEMVEPYLLKEGFIVRTARGRQALDKAFLHLGLAQNHKTVLTELL